MYKINKTNLTKKTTRRITKKIQKVEISTYYKSSWQEKLTMLHPAVLIFLASSLIVESLISYSIHTTTLPIPQVVSGKAVLNMLSYMQEFSIHMFRQTDNFSPPARDNTKISRNKHIKPRVLKLSIAPPLSSSYRYFFLEVWGMSPLSATKKITSLVSSKWDQPSCNTSIRCSLSFTISRLSTWSTRGVYSARGCVSQRVILPINLLSTEAKLQAAINHSFFHFETFRKVSSLCFCLHCTSHMVILQRKVWKLSRLIYNHL